MRTKKKKTKPRYPTIRVVPQGRDVIAIGELYQAFVFGSRSSSYCKRCRKEGTQYEGD